ncbi:MAG: hypothetical protein ACRD3T_18665, partial [Terriglobia bacterium]
YSDRELTKLSRVARQSGAGALVTTEKDLMNLPRGWRLDIPVLICRIEAQFTEPEKLEEALLDLLEKRRLASPAAAPL